MLAKPPPGQARGALEPVSDALPPRGPLAEGCRSAQPPAAPRNTEPRGFPRDLTTNKAAPAKLKCTGQCRSAQRAVCPL